MAIPTITINISEGNLNRQEPDTDNIAAMVLPEATFALPAGSSTILYSLKQAEDLGFSASEDINSTFLHYENIKEFFREHPNGELHILVTTGLTLVDMLGNSSTAGAIEPFIVQANGRIKQLAIMADDADSNWFADNLVADDLIAKAQGLVDRLAANNLLIDVIFIEGHGFDYTPAAAPDLRLKNARNVGVVVGGDRPVAGLNATFNSYASIGTVLGSSTKKQVHESFAEAKNENSITSPVDDRFLSVKISSNLGVNDLYTGDPAAMKALHDKGYIFPRKVPFKSGYYWNQSSNCVATSVDINSIELAQVINKAIRLTAVVLAPYINKNFDITKAGRLTEIARKTIAGQIRQTLETNMANNISNSTDDDPITILVDPAKDDNNQAYPSLVTDATLRVFLGLRPKGKAEQIILTVGFKQ